MFTGAISFLVAIEGAESGFQFSDLQALVVYLPISVVASIVLLVPMTLVWNIAFLASGNGLSSDQHKATLASGISALIGVALICAFLLQLTADTWAMVFTLFPASLLPIFVATVLTWKAFRSGKVEEAQ